MSTTETVWVIDTSSVTEIRRKFTREDQKAIYSKLDEYVERGVMVYSKKVVAELERNRKPNSEEPDLPYEWVKRNEQNATRYADNYDIVKRLLAHPQVRKVLDPDKTGGEEEADIYVLALAEQLRTEHGAEVVVLVEETKDTPTKISMSTACGHLRLLRLPMVAFVEEQGLSASSDTASSKREVS